MEIQRYQMVLINVVYTIGEGFGIINLERASCKLQIDNS